MEGGKEVFVCYEPVMSVFSDSIRKVTSASHNSCVNGCSISKLPKGCIGKTERWTDACILISGHLSVRMAVDAQGGNH